MELRDDRSGGPFALYFFFKVLPALIGGGSIYLGYRLFILGVTGQASLRVQSATVSSQLLNAAPGLFFAIGGIVIVLVAIWKGVMVRSGGNPYSQSIGVLPPNLPFT